MSNFERLLWTLNSKGLSILDSFEGDSDKLAYVKIKVTSEGFQGWNDLLSRFLKVYKDDFGFCIQSPDDRNIGWVEIHFQSGVQDSEKLDKSYALIESVISMEEYKYPKFSRTGGYLDVKLGLSCNNNCLHCVVKPNIYKMQDEYPGEVIVDSGIGMQCTRDLKFDEVINILRNADSKINQVVLTGGEPTIRKDLVPILKWIYFNRPDLNISIQTNGRNLSDEKLVRAIRRYTRSINFAVAIHGNEETHNIIVNNRKEKGNPYQETINGVRNLFEYFDGSCVRSEMVLSNRNIDEIMDSVKYQYESIGIKKIGISYPHLDGFDKEYIIDTAPTMDKVVLLMKELNTYLGDKEDLEILLEEIPACFYNELDGAIKVKSFGFIRDNATINFMGDENNNFAACWGSDHAKFSNCPQCSLNDKCVGIWKETKDLSEPFAKPIHNISFDLCQFLKKYGWNISVTDMLK